MDHRLEAQHHLMLLDKPLQAVDEAQVVVDELEVEGREPFVDECCILLLALFSWCSLARISCWPIG